VPATPLLGSEPTPLEYGGPSPLERYLVEGTPLPDADALARARVAALAYTRMSSDDPARPTHRDAYTRATALHLKHKLAFLPLARAWRDAGVDVIVFKGFYLAEFVYEQPAQRHYNDIDVIVRPELGERAVAIAREHGWTLAWSRRDSLYATSHEEAILTKAGTVIEVHRFIIDCQSARDALQRRYTEAAWARSSEVAWEGTAFRVLAPCDSALMGLVLARAWSGGDDWHLKPADYPDLQAASARLGLTKDELERRAAELGCSATLGLVLQRCDPWRGRLRLQPPTARERRRWYLAVMPERGHLGVERGVATLRRLPGIAVDTILQMPRLLRTERALRRGASRPESRAPSARTAAPRRGAPALRSMERNVRGIKWAARLLHLGRDPCRLRSYALFDALRSMRFPVRLKEGRSPDDGGVLHAWIEVDGVVLRGLQDVRDCHCDEIVACYHSPSAAT